MLSPNYETTDGILLRQVATLWKWDVHFQHLSCNFSRLTLLDSGFMLQLTGATHYAFQLMGKFFQHMRKIFQLMREPTANRQLCVLT